MTLEELIAKYVALRDKKAAIEKRQKEELVPLVSAMNKIEGVLLQSLQELGGEEASMKTAHGTAYIKYATSAKIQDWEAFFTDYVLPNQAFDMLNKACNKTAVAEFVETHKQPPPGVEWNRVATIGINRPRPK